MYPQHLTVPYELLQHATQSSHSPQGSRGESQACRLCLQVRAPSLEAPEWEHRIHQYAALAEQVAAQVHCTDAGCARINTEEVAAAAAQHAQEWVHTLLQAVRAQKLVQIQV